jgi:hypothetical protein
VPSVRPQIKYPFPYVIMVDVKCQLFLQIS